MPPTPAPDSSAHKSTTAACVRCCFTFKTVVTCGCMRHSSGVLNRCILCASAVGGDSHTVVRQRFPLQHVTTMDKRTTAAFICCVLTLITTVQNMQLRTSDNQAVIRQDSGTLARLHIGACSRAVITAAPSTIFPVFTCAPWYQARSTCAWIICSGST